MKRFISLLLVLFLFGYIALMPKDVEAVNKIRAFTEIEGGGTGSLDAIPCGDLAENDLALAYDVNSTTMYFYWFDDGDTTAEASPFFIRPDDYASCADGVWKLLTAWGTAGTAQPAIIFRDSDQAMDDVAKIYADANDANDSYAYFQVEVAGGQVTFITLDGVLEQISFSKDLTSTGTISGLKIITTDADGHTVTTDEAKGGVIVETGNQQTVVLPSAVAGMNLCVIADGADGSAEVYVDCDAGDHFEYDGTTMANGEYIYNNSDLKGDRMCFLAIDADTWIVWYSGDTTVAEENP